MKAIGMPIESKVVITQQAITPNPKNAKTLSSNLDILSTPY